MHQPATGTIHVVPPEIETYGRTSGEILHALRQHRGLTLRDVAAATQQIAERQKNEEFSISAGRLSEIENKGAVPNIFRLYSLSVVYQVDLKELLTWFGVPQTQ